VLDAFRTTRGPGGVHHEEEVGGVARDRLDGLSVVCVHDRLVLVFVVAQRHVERVAEPVDDHRLGQVDVGPESGVVRLRLLVERVLTAIVAVAGDEVLRVGGVDPGRERLRRQPREDDVMRRPDPGTRQHRDRQFGNHREVQRHHVVLFDPQIAEAGRERVHFAVEVEIGVRPALSALAEPADRELVPALVEVAVDAVGRGVEPPVRKPLVEGRIAVVEDGLGGTLPVEQVGGAAPRLRSFLGEGLVQSRVAGDGPIAEPGRRLDGGVPSSSPFVRRPSTPA